MVFEAWGLGKTILTLCKQRRKPEEWQCGAVGSGVGPVRTEERQRGRRKMRSMGVCKPGAQPILRRGEICQVQLVGEANEA